MANSIPKKRARAEQLRKRRAQAVEETKHGNPSLVLRHWKAFRNLRGSLQYGHPGSGRRFLMRWRPTQDQIALAVDCATGRISIGSAAALLGVSPRTLRIFLKRIGAARTQGNATLENIVVPHIASVPLENSETRFVAGRGWTGRSVADRAADEYS